MQGGARNDLIRVTPWMKEILRHPVQPLDGNCGTSRSLSGARFPSSKIGSTSDASDPEYWSDKDCLLQ